jgi:HAD superfamily hydrolase (TIGR01484 family)
MQNYQAIIADADGTLADTREAISTEMAQVIAQLLRDGYTFAVISGATFTRLVERIPNQLPAHTPLDNLYLLPASGSLMYAHQDSEWQAVYTHLLSEEDKAQIRQAFDTVLSQSLVDIPSQQWGEQLEDREASFAFSALGQNAPRSEKDKWDPHESKRRTLIAALQPLLPEYHLLIGGSTTIDINKESHGKDFGVGEFLSHTSLTPEDVYFIGDQLSPGGNDYPATTLNIDSYHTQGPADTLHTLQSFLGE